MRQFDRSGRAHAGGYVAKEGGHELRQPAFNLIKGQFGGHDAAAAIDVIADAAGRNDAFVQIEGRHAADGEPYPQCTSGMASEHFTIPGRWATLATCLALSSLP